MTSRSDKRDNRFILVLFLSFALGVLVALVVFFWWRSYPADFQNWFAVAALVICPPFILSYAIGATPDSAFAIVLGVATIIFANGCLYAGVAAGMYAIFTVVRKKKA